MATKGKNTVLTATELAVSLVEEMGLSLWDIRFEKEGGAWYLRYFLDKAGGITITDLTDFSRAVEKKLDAADPIEHSYTLEVCSPGIERQLITDRHFEQYFGHTVTVRMIRPIAGEREFIGVLTAKNGDEIKILTENGDEMVFLKNEAAYVKLYADFTEGEQT